MKITANIQKWDNSKTRNQGVNYINPRLNCDSTVFGAKLSETGKKILAGLNETEIREAVSTDPGTLLIGLLNMAPTEVKKGFVDSMFRGEGFALVQDAFNRGLVRLANGYLELISEVVPSKLFDWQIPKSLTILDSFIPVAKNVTGCEELTTTETITFLNSNNHSGRLNRMIDIVNRYATRPRGN